MFVFTYSKKNYLGSLAIFKTFRLLNLESLCIFRGATVNRGSKFFIYVLQLLNYQTFGLDLYLLWAKNKRLSDFPWFLLYPSILPLIFNLNDQIDHKYPSLISWFPPETVDKSVFPKNQLIHLIPEKVITTNPTFVHPTLYLPYNWDQHPVPHPKPFLYSNAADPELVDLHLTSIHSLTPECTPSLMCFVGVGHLKSAGCIFGLRFVFMYSSLESEFLQVMKWGPLLQLIPPLQLLQVAGAPVIYVYYE